MHNPHDVVNPSPRPVEAASSNPEPFEDFPCPPAGDEGNTWVEEFVRRLHKLDAEYEAEPPLHAVMMRTRGDYEAEFGFDPWDGKTVAQAVEIVKQRAQAEINKVRNRKRKHPADMPGRVIERVCGLIVEAVNDVLDRPEDVLLDPEVIGYAVWNSGAHPTRREICHYVEAVTREFPGSDRVIEVIREVEEWLSDEHGELPPWWHYVPPGFEDEQVFYQDMPEHIASALLERVRRKIETNTIGTAKRTEARNTALTVLSDPSPQLLDSWDGLSVHGVAARVMDSALAAL